MKNSSKKMESWFALNSPSLFSLPNWGGFGWGNLQRQCLLRNIFPLVLGALGFIPVINKIIIDIISGLKDFK
jgi:hypothetical protein